MRPLRLLALGVVLACIAFEALSVRTAEAQARAPASGCTGDCTFNSVSLPANGKLNLNGFGGGDFIWVNSGSLRLTTSQSSFSFNAPAAFFGSLSITQSNATMVIPTTDTSASPGAATANTISGTAAIAAAGSSAVITDSTVATTSRVLVMSRNAAVDSTCTALRVSAVASGSFTVACNAAATAAVKFDWFVLN